jgi:hypothetical protein
MVNSSLNDLSRLINRHLYHYEKIAGLLCKAEALAEIGLSNGFLEQKEDTQRNYFWALRDLLTEANALNEKYLAEEMRCLSHVERNTEQNTQQPI